MARTPSHSRPVARVGKPAASTTPFWTVKAQGEGDARSAEITIYGVIGEAYDYWTLNEVGNSAQSLLDAVRALGDVKEVTIRIHSLGGSAWDGSAIYSIFAQMKARKTVIIDGIAASAASVIAMAGDVIRMPANALLMIHNPSCDAWGEAADLQKAIEALNATKRAMVGAYRTKNPSLSDEAISDIMDAETWYTGEEALAAGFADELLAPVTITASAAPAELRGSALAKFRNAPAAVSALLAETTEEVAEETSEATETVDEPKVEETVAEETVPEVVPVSTPESAGSDDLVAKLSARLDELAAQMVGLVKPEAEAPAAPPKPTAPAAPAPVKPDAAEVARVKAFAVKHGVEATFNEYVELGSSIEALRVAVGNAAAAKETRIDGTTAPFAETRTEPAKSLSPAQIASYYDKLNGAK